MKLRFLVMPLMLGAALLVGACSEPAETEVESEAGEVEESVEGEVEEEEAEIEGE
ncbi:MAG: hypothetical protein ACFB4J_05285 [Elainellaceae cyanobacterium]